MSRVPGSVRLPWRLRAVRCGQDSDRFRWRARCGARKKRLSGPDAAGLYAWLAAFFGDQDGPADPPESILLNHDAELVKRLLVILEAVEWRWTLSDILAQPEGLLADVISLKALGEQIARTMKNNA